MRPSLLLSAAALLALAACATGPELRVDRDPSANLRSYRTFGWHEPLSTDASSYTTLMTQHLKQSTRRALERQGYAYSDKEPDLRVNFSVRIEDRQETRGLPSPGRTYRGWAISMPNIDTVDVKAGTLAIDLVDARRQALVWRGVAEGRLKPEATQDPARAVEAAVGEIFTAFPDGQRANGRKS